MSVLRPSLKFVFIIAFALVAATPVVFITLWLRAGIESNLLAEAHDKNELLARNIATPVAEYLRAARGNLNVLGILASDHPAAVGDAIRVQHYYREIWLLPRGRGKTLVWDALGRPLAAPAGAETAISARVFATPAQTGTVVRDPIGGQPTVLLAHATPAGMLVGALDLGPLRALCGGIHFGKRGHCAITDARGNIVVHPNPLWMREIKNISAWPIVKSGMAGHRGVMRFYSPFIHADMIAGYASVPDFHWVVLTPQPLSELTASAGSLLRRGLTVALLGLGLALLLALALGMWLSRSIGSVVAGVKKVREGEYAESFPRLGLIAPLEIEMLRNCGVAMADSIQQALRLKDGLNEELERRVSAATDELAAANARLAAQAQVDELTGLLNRRGLWSAVARLTQDGGEEDGEGALILLDVDHFKGINDAFGHAMGDRVLVHVARLISSDIRDGDAVIRYAGDEFLVLMPHCDLGTAQRRARKLCERVASSPLLNGGHVVAVTLSIGVTGWRNGLTRQHFSELLGRADEAMYEAKRAGRNQVSAREAL